MSLKDIALQTAKQRSYSAKSLPSKLWGAIVVEGNRSSPRWNKKQLIEQAYERNPAFYAAVNIIAQTVASIPVYVEYKVDGKTKTTSDHPILKVLERGTGREELIEYLVKFLLTTGDAYAQIVFADSERRPIGAIVMPSQYVDNIEGNLMKPIRAYSYMQHKEIIFDESEVIHIYNPSLSRYFEGMSPGIPLQENIDLNNAAITWNKNIALGGGVPPLVAKASGMSPEQAQEARDAWQAQRGANNSHRLAVISDNLELTKFDISPHDAEWEKAVLQAMRVIFMTLGVSSSIMNDAGNKTYNNVHDSRKALYQEGSIPLAKKIYAQIVRKLSPYYRDMPKIVLDVDNIDGIQEDKKMQAERLVRLKDAGIITANEARVELRFPLSPDEEANKLVNSSVVNNIPKVDRPQDESTTPTPPDPTL